MNKKIEWNEYMKKMGILIGMIAACSALASGEIHTIKGENVEILLSALNDTGVKFTKQADISFINISKVDCIVGTLQSIGSYASCSFLSAENKVLNTTGKTALRIVHAIESSGIKKNKGVENASIRVLSVNCVVGGMPRVKYCAVKE